MIKALKDSLSVCPNLNCLPYERGAFKNIFLSLNELNNTKLQRSFNGIYWRLTAGFFARGSRQEKAPALAVFEKKTCR
jgi:hypothetical protein